MVPMAVSPSMLALLRFMSLAVASAWVSSSNTFIKRVFISRTRVRDARYKIYFLAALSKPICISWLSTSS